MTRSIGFVLALASVLGVAVQAHAAEEIPSAAAAEHYRRGLEHAKRGDYQEALAEFEQAYALEPDAIVLCNIGQTSVPLDRPRKALDALRRCLAGGGKQLSPAYRASVEKQIALLEASFADLEVTTEPAGASVTVDGAEVGTTPLAQPVKLTAGTHVVSATRPGAAAETRVVTVVEGQREKLSLALPDVPAAPPSTPGGVAVPPEPKAAAEQRPAATVPASADAEREHARFPTAYVLMGAGVVLGGVTVGHYIWNHGRVEEYRAAEAQLATDTSPGRHERQVANNELAESIQHASVVTVSLGVATGALVAAGVVLLVTEAPSHGGRERASATKKSIQLPDVAVTRDSLGLSWRGTW